jgi:thiol:disulfide interchange protein DsbC
MSKHLIICVIVVLFACSASFAMDGCGDGKCAKCHTLTLEEANGLLRAVGKVNNIQLAPVNGLWRLELEKDGRRGVVFMDYGKKNLIAGTVFPLESDKVSRQETESKDKRPAPSANRIAQPDALSIPLENSIIIGNLAGHKKLFVFTDPDCPFCARMHAELKKLALLEPDLAIYVKMFPLKMHPGAYDKARVIIGGGSPELLDRAFAGAALTPPGAEYGKKAVDETIMLGESLGIHSTPTLVLPDGRVMPGYKRAPDLKNLLATSGK